MEGHSETCNMVSREGVSVYSGPPASYAGLREGNILEGVQERVRALRGRHSNVVRSRGTHSRLLF